MDSILNVTKKLAGLGEEYEAFDTDIIVYINSIFFILKQVGIGPANGFSIEDDSQQWADFLPADDPNIHAVKPYLAAKVRLQFDPPMNSSHLSALKEIISEFEWRLNFASESEVGEVGV